MKRFFAAAVASLSVQLSCAAVVAVNPNAEEKTRAFLDARTGLMWSNANAFAPAPFDAAAIAVAESTIAGFDDWRLPSMSEFLGLYQTQDPGGSAQAMPLTPFATPNANWYTTTDVNPAQSEQNFAFGPTHTAAHQNQTYFRTTTVGVWAVRLETVPTPVPEPSTLMLILAGIVGLAACRARALHRG